MSYILPLPSVCKLWKSQHNFVWLDLFEILVIKIYLGILCGCMEWLSVCLCGREQVSE